MLEKQYSPHLRKRYRFPRILYFFIHPQPNNIGPVRQQPRDWGSLLISRVSESGRGRGAQLLLISFATTRLHGVCNGSINGMEDGGGGGGHTLQSHSLRTKDMYPPPPPQFSEFFFVLDWEGAQKSPPRGFGDLGRMAIYFQGSREHWLLF